MKCFKSYLSLYIVLVSLFLSCKKAVTVDPPTDKLETNLVFSDNRTAEASVTGLYRKMVEQQNNFGSYPITLYGGLSADELYSTSVNALRDEFQKNSIAITNTVISNNFWTRAYEYIYHTNACIEGLSSSTSISASLQRQLLGEMKFVRAMEYFYLVNLFGDVPLVLSTNYKVNATLPRTPADNVYNQIIQDLVDAKDLLTPTYATAGRARPNKYAAAALLARVYLYRQNWSEAENNASEVINSNSYSLVKTLDSAFLNNNKEAIWQLYTLATPAFAVIEATNFIPSTAAAKPNIAITDSLANAFELVTDKRKVAWVTKKIVAGVTYYFAGKYKTRASNTTECITVLRLAEQYLIRAEARARRNDLINAIKDINIIRDRAGLPLLATSLTEPQVTAALEKERRLELLVEWGHRWLDLKRTGKADAVLSTFKGSNWQATDKLYPIPYDQTQLNPNLTQNPGY